MLRGNLKQISWCQLRKCHFHKENVVSKPQIDKNDISRIRNIGIMAHIDAGKTTTTERMLFYSGSIRNMGEVHDGNTVTDYMDQERERGITIVSAAVTFNWKHHRFNLIDTPGHIDFTMGVEQSLHVLDGSIVILDSSAGVEAQTMTVWRQADRFKIPRIVYANKMDRPDANFDMCLQSIESKFNILTLPTQMPIKNESGFAGIVNILTMERVTFDKASQGQTFVQEPITEAHGHLWEQVQEKRRILTDKLSEIDDKLAETIIELESLDKIPAQQLVESIRRCTIHQKGIPVLLGSSYKNIGVQMLMDSIILYLPSPNFHAKTDFYRSFDRQFSARAFKVVHDKQRGPITFFRVFTGELSRGQKVYNVQKKKSEQGGRLYGAYADDFVEINEVSAGNIAGLAGLKSTVSGDLLTSSGTAAARAKEVLEARKGLDSAETERFFAPSTVPEPVFFCSIEPPTMSAQVALDTALEELQREDPSLRVTVDDETGQTVLGGMGELHIDIIKQRIRSEYKIDVDLGPLQIAYKETIVNPVKTSYVHQHKIGTTNHNVNITMSLIPNFCDSERLVFDKTKESASNIAGIHPRILNAVRQGVPSALMHGPKMGCPVVNVGVKLHWLEVARGTSDTMVTSGVARCIQKMLQETGVILLEPIMQLEVVVPEEYSSTVVGDLGRRRAQILGVDVRGNNKVVRSLTPLSELLGYATNLRILSSGTGTFSSTFHAYQEMGPLEEQEAITRITGF